MNWAAEHGRVVPSHDVKTLVGFAHAQVNSGLTMPGVIIVHDAFNVGKAVEDLLIVIERSLDAEIANQVRYVPP